MSRAATSYLLRLVVSNSKDHEVAVSGHADTPGNRQTSHSRISYPYTTPVDVNDSWRARISRL
jgi:hypothetical protein